MKKSRISLILVLSLMLTFIIAPVAPAGENHEIEVGIAGDNNFFNFYELSSDELARLREEMLLKYFFENPEVVMERKFTEEEMQKARSQKREHLEELLLRNQLQLNQPARVKLINIGSQEIVPSRDLFLQMQGCCSFALSTFFKARYANN